MKYAKVIVDISHEKLDRAFEYSVPDELTDKVRPGVMVEASFGKGNRKIKGYVIDITETPSFDPGKIKPLLGVCEGSVEIESELIRLASWMHRNYGGTIIKALKTVIPVKKTAKPKEKKTVSLLLDADDAMTALALFERKNNKARARLLGALIKEPKIPYEVVTDKLNVSSSVMKALSSLGMIEIISGRVMRNPVNAPSAARKNITLNEEQRKAADRVISDMENGKHETYLLRGVTGSGKTEVYIELIDYVVSKGKKAIVLIPEIALTYQTVMRFYNRFGERVSILNSRMSQGERYDQYERAKSGDIDVIIGPRSALFAPFEKLGIIIIDEEHETSYQSENVPRYHARETAVARARIAGASVVLGSATPSLDSYYRAKEGIYNLLELKERAGNSKLAQTEIVDLREELKSGNKSVFSRRLQAEIKRALEKEEQVMLFLNRRGMAGFVSCRSCGHVVKCPHCDVSLSYHRGGILKCHYCGYEEPMINECPKCGSRAIGSFKAGTQKIEEAVNRMFPKAKTLRMDYDTTREKDSYENILSAFANQEADILIGTQMIVKGHDFPNVTLVGILAADMSLFVPDFRAKERTFQLITQAAGRAGRGDKKGRVILQTYHPEDYAVTLSAAQDYEGFYEEEIGYRKILKYPPVWNMLKILFSSPSKKDADEASMKVFAHIKGIIKDAKNISVIGPSDDSVSKVNDIYKRLVYIKADDIRMLVRIKDEVERISENADINIQFQFN
ncbi:MAG: primosomal protein N' [Eubacterium sp.]|nr:primosomal protein N' [Eubacterium sp.]